MADPTYKGEDYALDPAVEKGPLTNRRCTDLFCLLIFAAAVAFGVYIGIYAVENGDPASILAPMDADGNLCGKTPGYKDYPYLYFSNINSPFPLPFGVCVSECPATAESPVNCVKTTNTPLGCEMYSPQYATTTFLDRWCIPVYNELPESVKSNYDNLVGSIGLDDVQGYIRDIERCWKVYLIAIATCMVIVFLYNWFLRCFAEILTWIAIILVGCGIFGLGWLVKDYATVNYPEGDTTQKWLNIGAYTIWVLLGVYALAICCMFYSIKISVKVLKTSATIIMHNMRMIIIPLVGIAFVALWVCFSTYFLLYLGSCGEVVQKESLGYYYSTYVWTKTQKGYLWFSLFLFFWVNALIIAATQYVLIVAVVSWYFTSNPEKRGVFSIMRGYWWCLRYNLGSLLFGSLLIAIVWMIRTVFEYINKKIMAANSGQPMPRALVALTNCIRCCLACCHRFIKYVNLNAYCQIALTGESFCMAAINGFCLILKNSAAFIFTGGIGALFNFLGKITVTIANCFVAFLIIDTWSELKEINSPLGPIAVVFIISFCMSSLFLGMYTTCATCLLHCLFADIDICNTLSKD